MQTNTTFSILFWLKRSKAKDGQAPLYARVTVNGKRNEISLKRKIILTDWDNSKSRVKGKKASSKLLNSYIEQAQHKLFQCYQELQAQNKLISPQSIKAKFLGDDETHHSLLEVIEYHNKKEAEKLSWGTLKNYFTTQRYIKEFLKNKRKTSDVYLSELSYGFLIEFERYLRTYQPKDHKKPMGNNTVMKHIERFRKIISLAYKLEWISKDPFIKFEAKFDKVEREFLSEIELVNIIEKQFSIERLSMVKDLFVFSCYTGLAYIDVMNLKAENLVLGIDGNKWIVTKRQKTSNPVKIPLLPKALEIIKKYENHPKVNQSKKVLPNLSNQKLNSYLKEIADLSGITKNLTFHMARHTFATTVTLSNGVPIETVSKLLGHTKIATTQIYAKVIEKKVSEDISILRNKMNRVTNQPKHSNSNAINQ